jgi:PAS domain S-box-containing protein
MVVIVAGLASVAAWLVELATGHEWLGGHHPLLKPFLDQDTTRMAILTGILFTDFGCVLLLLGSPGQRASNIAHALLLPVALLTYLALAGYLFDVPELYTWLHLGMAMNTEVAFWGICIAAFCIRPRTWLTSIFTGAEAGSVMARRLLPALLILPLLIGYLRVRGEDLGHFPSYVGVALVATAYAFCFLGLVWLVAKSVNRADLARRRSEESVAVERGNLQAIFDVVNVGMLLIDETGAVRRVNNAVARWIGKDLSPDLGRQPGDLVGCMYALADPKGCGHAEPCGQCRIRGTLEAVLGSGEPVHGVEAQSTLLMGGKEVRMWLEVSADPLLLDGRKHVILVLNNITARKQAEEALRKAKEDLEARVRERTADLGKAVEVLQEEVNLRMTAEREARATSLYARGLLEASLDPLVTISPEGKVTDVNKATEEATGLGRARLIGTDFSGYFTEPSKAAEGYRRVLAEGEVYDYPLSIRHVSGGTMDVLYNAAVYRNEAGEVQGVFAAARDITQRKRAEEELDKYRKNLEEMVKLRTIELQETAADLARSNRDLEQFAYVSSHDLQEPLRMVTGFMQLIDQKYHQQLDHVGQKYIHYAVDGAKRMQQLIVDLLAYSRVGTQAHAAAPADTAQLLQRALFNLQRSIKENQAKVTWGALPTVPVDGTQLTQVFQNLIGNAIKFHGDQPPQVHVDAWRNDKFWEFTVKDNGLGIDPEYSDKIFVIFQRLHAKEKYPGTGIGLAICKKIIERHGGKIWVESHEGQGATFHFTLPAKP